MDNIDNHVEEENLPKIHPDFVISFTIGGKQVAEVIVPKGEMVDLAYAVHDALRKYGLHPKIIIKYT